MQVGVQSLDVRVYYRVNAGLLFLDESRIEVHSLPLFRGEALLDLTIGLFLLVFEILVFVLGFENQVRDSIFSFRFLLSK